MKWQPIETAPMDSTIVQLLYEDGVIENSMKDGGRFTTIGVNALKDTGIDEWQIVGWNWCQDCFVDIRDAPKPIAWAPLLKPED